MCHNIERRGYLKVLNQVICPIYYLLPATSVAREKKKSTIDEKIRNIKPGMRSEHRKELKVHFKYASDVNLTTETKKKTEEQSSPKLN